MGDTWHQILILLCPIKGSHWVYLGGCGSFGKIKEREEEDMARAMTEAASTAPLTELEVQRKEAAMGAWQPGLALE